MGLHPSVNADPRPSPVKRYEAQADQRSDVSNGRCLAFPLLAAQAASRQVMSTSFGAVGGSLNRDLWHIEFDLNALGGVENERGAGRSQAAVEDLLNCVAVSGSHRIR